MKKLLKFYIFSVVLLSDFVLFAQPGDDDGSGGVEGGDPPPTPINGKLLLLALLGIVFVSYKLMNRRKAVS